MTALFADIHFLPICLDKLDLYLHMLRKDLPREPELAIVQKRYRRLLKDSTDCTDHVDHIDRRIERRVCDLGNLMDGKFPFDGKTFEIGPSRETEAETFFEDLLRAPESVAQRQRTRQAKPDSTNGGGPSES